jgi:hypothetical protein
MTIFAGSSGKTDAAERGRCREALELNETPAKPLDAKGARMGAFRAHRFATPSDAVKCSMNSTGEDDTTHELRGRRGPLPNRVRLI